MQSRRGANTSGQRSAYRGLVLLGVVALLVGALVIPASAAPASTGPAGAATGGQTALAAGPTHGRLTCDAFLCLEVTYDGYFGFNVRRMAAWLANNPRTGHFEFFGPGGHIANSVQKTWRRAEYFGVNGFWTGNRGALWCVRFWVYSNGHWGTISGNYCQRAGS
jgi:hypothetical protein